MQLYQAILLFWMGRGLDVGRHFDLKRNFSAESLLEIPLKLRKGQLKSKILQKLGNHSLSSARNREEGTRSGVC